MYDLCKTHTFILIALLVNIDSSLLPSVEHLPDLLAQIHHSCETTSSPSLSVDHDIRTSIDNIRQMTCSTTARHEYTRLTVHDVYDEASSIGKDFERIIEGK
jgi:hypothetical protein